MQNGAAPQMDSMGAAGGPPATGGGYRRKGFYKKTFFWLKIEHKGWRQKGRDFLTPFKHIRTYWSANPCS